MGKSRNKNKDKETYTGPTRKGRGRDESDSEESCCSHITFDEDMRSVQGDLAEDVDSLSFLDTLAEHIENASHKKHLAMCSQYIPDFVTKWRSTLIDIIAKNLKKTDEEVAISAVLLALASLQIGDGMGSDVEDCLAILRTHVTDHSKTENLRALCSFSNAITSHVASTNDESISASTKACFMSAPSLSSSLDVAFGDFSKLASFLEADQLDIRVATGEALAFLYEIRSAYRPNFRVSNHQQIVEQLSALCNDSSKGKTKKNRRVQRFTFRQIYSTIVDKETPSLTIKFNRESVVLDSCSSKLLYDICCEMAAHDAASKFRNRIRGKQRDKRNVVI
uniref:IFRD domain-containing protein n=1 Tax=Angiostrongylus cantonensis TaxID=6313 RepID=A0A0K0DEQ7_ANGCA